MTVKKFCVQIIGDAETKFQDSDLELALALRTACQQIATFKSSGPMPLVSVIEEERAEETKGGLYVARL